jgi:hypothetical protein
MDSEGFWILSEEKLYLSADPEGHIIDGQLIEAERQRPAPLEPAHGPLDDVAPPGRTWGASLRKPPSPRDGITTRMMSNSHAEFSETT